VRRICAHCKEPDTNIDPLIREEMANSLGIEPEDVKAWRGPGCPECSERGYRGRVAIFELFLLDEELQDLISVRSSTSELRHAARDGGMHSLREDGWEKVTQGVTTIEEITRITGAMQIAYKGRERKAVATQSTEAVVEAEAETHGA
jgi:type II secretory ATPase GspE/PulE/Tfp pilus assembly ATPase PilB-like protein